MLTRLRTSIALISSIGLVIGSFIAVPAFANPNYPTAAEVSAAKRNVADQQKMIERIEALIASQEAEVEVLNREVAVKSEIYNTAQEQVDVITRQVEVLTTQSEKALAEANDANEKLGQIASQMLRGGGGGTTLNLFLNSAKAEDLLFQLGAQDKLAQQTELIYQQSLERQKLADAITVELEAIEVKLAELAAIAEKAFAEAQAAARAVEDKIAANKAQGEVFYGQLASLRETATDLERQRAEGLAWERRQAAGTRMPMAPELYDVGPPDLAKVAQVVAFARAQLGEPYVLGASGPNAWDCSGLTMKAYAEVGINIGWHSVSNQFINAMDRQQLVPLYDIEAGDLVFWSIGTSYLNRYYGQKYHIGIYIGDGWLIDAPNPSKPVRMIQLNQRLGELVPYAARPTA
jgi:cell wall-associated NlpC family hydrolase